MLMQQKALHDAGETGRFARQLVEQRRIAAGRRHQPRLYIEVEDVLRRHLAIEPLVSSK